MKLKELREERGLTQAGVASGIQTSQRNIGRWESGLVSPNVDFVTRLADFFQVSTDYLLGRTNEPNMIDSPKFSLSPEDLQLIQDYHALSDQTRQIVFDMIHFAAEKEQRG